jgi:hypothetical protein
VCGEIDALGGKGLVIVDTSAAYFGRAAFREADENDNTQMLAHARACRKLTEAKGNPSVVVLAHPAKGANHENLMPRGGYAFLCEVDANLTCWNDDGVITVSYNKLRGPTFEPLTFHLESIVLDGVVDVKGREVRSIMLKHAGEEAAEEHEHVLKDNQRRLLMCMYRNPSASLRELAVLCGWSSQTSALKAIRHLMGYRYAKQDVAECGYELTGEGKKRAERLRKEFREE